MNSQQTSNLLVLYLKVFDFLLIFPLGFISGLHDADNLSTVHSEYETLLNGR